ncbi:cation-translocating P-type ATPase [Lysobacter sp. A03]|uniref:heavy metal translocating P-type ATPase n=1 Tax=Lysobacter sp. A03 TaxID=1199154 RepID=UPI0005B6B747|nr:cation-translocating P-type ATPase [Lysobacter sp. A03]KIQ97232.1 Lead, cadmium, zinc and mercury transporting ATPase [Lysobacter sp. A03]
MTAAADFDPASLDGLDRGIVGIDGLWCPSCAAAVGRAMSAVPGITRAQVSFAGASAAIAWEKGTDLAAMARKVSAMGYRLTAPDLGDGMEERIVGEMRRVAIRLAVSVVFGMWTMLLSILLYINPDGIADGATGRAFALAAGAMAVPVVAWAGAPILLAGWRTARVGVPGMDTLVSLGVAGAVAASVWSLATARCEVWFDTAVMLVTLLTLGRLIEMATLRQSSRSIAALRTALPETARRIGEDGKAEEVLASEVRTGERIRVAAGERVSLDGLLSSGESRFDTSVLTGESVPRSIGQGEEVQAGFINLSRMVEIAVTAEMGARRIDRMGVDIATALHARPEIHRLADRLARVIVPLALSLALVTLLVGLATGMAGAAAGLRALSVLIIACPCAVAIAAPVSHLAATGAAAVRGIHFRTQAASESLGAVERVLFDKTGTLTEGRPVLRELHLQPGLSRARALALAAAAEHEVVHPVARALRESGGQGLLASTSERFSDGVAATIDGVDALIGSRGFLLRHGIAPPETQAQDAGLTAVYLAADGNWAATYLLGDALRPDAAATLSQLRSEGLALGMASGDAEAPCAFVGAEAGLAPDEIHAACTPEQKAELVAGGKAASTAFVGDGVNDMLAIVRADVGIAATDASPSTIALADVVIANGGMSAVAEAIDISRKARRVLRQNLVFSVGYNAVALTLAVFGTVPPLAAAVAMAASSIMVIGNAARLRAGVYTRSAQPGSSLSASA